MKKADTAGRQRTFNYTGNSRSSVALQFSTSSMKLPAEFFKAVREAFAGKTVKGGLNMIDPPEGGAGDFLRNYQDKFSPRSGSHLVAILQDEGLLDVFKEGNAVMVQFPP